MYKYCIKDSWFYFGRNLDVERSYYQSVVITPRNYVFEFTDGSKTNNHYAMIGMATVIDDYPLYAEATNEKGLSVAGLNFPSNAHYFEPSKTKYNISPFEFVPYLLSNCSNISEVEAILKDCTITNIDFSEKLPLSPLHWMINDATKTIVVESTIDGLKVYDNPVGVLTNNPRFDYHLSNLANYMNLSTSNPNNEFTKLMSPNNYGVGMGGIGLPGDLSPASRFVRAAFTKFNSNSKTDELSSVNQFFHFLDSVAMSRGVVMVKEDVYEFTLYSSCINTNKGIYYYKNYYNNEITAVHMHHENLDTKDLISFEWNTTQTIHNIN